MLYKVVIPAAGAGKRMGYRKNKLLISLQKAPIIVHTLNVFERDGWCDGIILVINEDDENEMKKHIHQHGITKVTTLVKGGKERQQSVFAGLKQIEKECLVLIHDGARPFVKISRIHQLVEAAKTHGAAVLAVPVKDTIKKADNEIVTETIDRSVLWSIQTPQAFQLSLIRKAHEIAEEDQYLGTDDASLLERINKKVMIVKGDYENIKITTKEDLYFAQSILDRIKSEKQLWL